MSVHKDKTTGKWYYTGKYRDLAGNRHDYKKRGFRTKGEAKDAEDTFLLKIKGGQGRIKMKDLIVMYHEEMSSIIKTSTLKLYDMIERIHIIPYFGDRYIDTIKTAEISKWNKERALTGNRGNPYCQDYINNLYIHMSGLLTFAVNHRFISYNPCKYSKPYKNPNQVSPEQESESNFWEVEEYKQFIAVVDDIEYIDIFETLFLTGLRIGELLALQWKNLDMEGKKLYIKATYAVSTKEVTSPKTPASVRTIDLPTRLVTRLSERYKRKAKIDGFNPDYFIFGDINCHHPHRIRYNFDKYIDTAGVKRITIHGLRHSHASYLLSNPSMSDLLVADRMGHSIDMLRRIYAHIYESRRTALVDYIEKL